jgi:hypothetical protein
MSVPDPREDESAETPDPSEHPARPGWLTGAEPSEIFTDGVEGEAPGSLRLVPPLPAPGAPPPKPPSAPKRAWTAAASSIPVLRRETSAAPRPVEDDDDDHDPLESTEPLDEMPSDAEASAPAPHARPLEEPWWIVAVDELRTNRRVQIAVAAVVLAIAAFTFWPRGDNATSLSTLRRHAHDYDGRAVTVHGRVGDVFSMSGGYAFYLRQGKESIVVFSRTRMPLRDQSLTVKGTISTGYLDGAPHQALFEDSHP